ncbi:hypothetical protein [Glycomyces harbinensis]|uniref:Uncharacterized protein n=1 Tax=Glycomyces harbinensis TaxID=58114 RepID=A0A1G6WP99_9ACTN|nr:hypothetical protein [Glycomyces harbinensis]SDD67698.1 hypothetical protein SAMN05216270_106145 [Glycomyces harbinensis]
MTDAGFIEGSAAEGDAGSEYVTLTEADIGTAYDAPAEDYGAADEDAAFEYDDTAYADMETATASSTIAFGDTADPGGARAGCTAGACPHPAAHPAETDWEQLVSAVPVEGQLGRFKPRCEGMSYPTEDDFRSAVGAVRPIDPDAFSLQRLRTGWNEEVAGIIGDWPGLIKSKLAELSTGWAGTDFDAFADQTDQVRTLLQGVLDDIEDATGDLKHREEAIYTLQGGDSGEIPYPAPMVGAEGGWTSLVAIHVRPGWWHGDCILMTCEEAERALELGGADPALAEEVRTFIGQRSGGALEPVAGVLPPERLQAGAEAATAFADRIAAEVAGYTERHAAIDESIVEKRTGQSEQLEALSATGSDRPYPDGADTSYMDLEPPSMEQPASPVAPQATQDPSPVPPGGDGSVRAEDAEAAATAPEESAPVDGAVSGGLAGGGGGFGFGGAGGSMTTAPVTAGGAVAGGGSVYSAAAPGMLGATGTTGPAAAGGSGSGGGVGSRTAVVGGQQADARKRSEKSEEDEEAEDEDLTFREIDNVWGYVKPGDDPYI